MCVGTGRLGLGVWCAVGGNDPPKMEIAMLPGSKWSVHQEHSGDVDELSGSGDHRTREGGSASRVLLSFACAPKKSSSQKSNYFVALPKKQTWNIRSITSQLMFLVLVVESLIVSEWSANEQGVVSIGGPLMLSREA